MGAGEWMVVEADESDGSFLRLDGTIGGGHHVRRLLVMLVTHDLCPILLAPNSSSQ